ncbi:AlkZ-related protein [Sutcliffiella halmapala]|uniref:AlkZ-related protein n=1 Tax=Sutcliffiella halmapala TaxID=79882 RepID=UPI000995A175|nr:hypothetical protein [Sutcliffiella halmapala]
MNQPIIHTYEEAVQVINELGLLPLAPLFDEYPALNRITLEENWHTNSELDPWKWRTQFAAEGVAAYGKFMKKKAVFISRGLLPYVKIVLGSQDSVQNRYNKGYMSREALKLFTIISEEEGIDTRVLRAKADMRDKEQKKSFDQALLELQGSMDIVVSGTKEKQDVNGEKNGWSSTSYETMKTWMTKNKIEELDIDKEEARKELIRHFSEISSEPALKKISKVLG